MHAISGDTARHISTDGQRPTAGPWCIKPADHSLHHRQNHFTFGSDCTDEGRRALETCRDGEGTDRVQVHELVARRMLALFEQQRAR
jgi:hypothetical protein